MELVEQLVEHLVDLAVLQEVVLVSEVEAVQVHLHLQIVVELVELVEVQVVLVHQVVVLVVLAHLQEAVPVVVKAKVHSVTVK